MSVYRETRPPASGALRFDDLAPDTRALLTASCRGHAALVPLLRSSFVLQGRPAGFWALATLLLALAVGVFFAAIGTLGEGMPPASMVSLITLLVTLAVVLVMLACRSWWLRGGLPFPAGNYLFARDLVMARRGRIDLIPTRALTFVQRSPRRLDVRGPGDSRDRIATFACNREGIADELLLERDSLDRAEQADDMAERIRLDPFCGERAGWGEPVRGEIPSRHWIESYAGVALLGLALVAASTLVTPRLTARVVHAVKLRQIVQAGAINDRRAFSSFFIREQEFPASLREAADDAQFRAVMRSGTWDDLLAYLKRGGSHAVEVSAEFHRRFCRDRTFHGYGPLAEWGRGPARDEADAFMFQRAIDQDGQEDLYDYLRYGSRRDEVRRTILPRRELDRAIRHGDLESLRRIKSRWEDTSGFVSEQRRLLPSPDMMQELTQAIDTLIDQHRVHLRERTGLRTSLARAVHQRIGQDLLLAPAPGLDEHRFTTMRVALEGVITTYVPRSMLTLRMHEEPYPPRTTAAFAPHTIVLDLDPQGSCQQLPCRRRLRMAFHDLDDTDTQYLFFSEPARDSGRTFGMAVTEALTRALLGDEKR